MSIACCEYGSGFWDTNLILLIAAATLILQFEDKSCYDRDIETTQPNINKHVTFVLNVEI